jgi:ribosomal RNA small subunit methyltransferase F
VANEVSNARRKALIFNLNRCGMLNTAVSAYDGTQIGDLAPEFFDKVLVDAPCS